MTKKAYGQIMKDHGLKLKKRLGQHFMVDPTLLQKIAKTMVPGKESVVVEIGSGLGTLTSELCKRSHWVYALEIDKSLKAAAGEVTRDFTNLTWHWSDALEFDLSGKSTKEVHPESPLVLCGNVPYYVTSEVVYSAFVGRPLWNRLAFVVQNELGRRMATPPGSRQFGRLSLWCQYRSQVRVEKSLPKKAFLPPPKVDSCLVTMNVYDEFPLLEEEEKVLDEISRTVFAQRRKTVLNTLWPLIGSKHQASKLGNELEIDLGKRPEALTMQEYTKLAKALASRKFES